VVEGVCELFHAEFCVVFETTEEAVVGSVLPVFGLFGGEKEVVHIAGGIVPEERGVVNPAIFGDVLGVAATLAGFDDVVVFFEEKVWDFPGILVEARGPAEDGFRIGGDVEGFMGKDEGDEEGGFIDDDGATAAEALVDGNAVFFDEGNVEVGSGVAGDAHDDRFG